MTPKTKAKKTLYKFLRTGLKSDNGEARDWELGVWRKEEEVDICHNGFHASTKPYQAFSYVQGEIIAKVSVRGKSVIQDDKECWSEMRIDKAWNWTKTDSVELAIFAAELVIGIFEKEHPNDKRPRTAIEAAKAYLKDPSDENRNASSVAASAAYASSVAAYTASYASYASASASAVAASAAYAAASYASYASAVAASVAASAVAASVAASAVAASAKKELISKIDVWFTKRLKKLTPWTK